MTTPPQPPTKTILILGGSWAGVALSHYLLHHVIPALPSTAHWSILLISSSPKTFCRPACPRALLSDSYFPQEKLFVDIAAQFTSYPPNSFRFLHGTVTSLDSTSRTVTVSTSSAKQDEIHHFEALVLATGASTPSPLLGLAPGESTTDLRKTWAAFREKLPSAKRIVVAGGGPTGVEVAGELAHHLNGGMSWSFPFTLPSRKQNPKVKIILVSSTKRILPASRESIAARAEAYLAALGVIVRTGVRVERVVPEEAGLTKEGENDREVDVVLSDGETVKADLYIPCVGTVPNTGYITRETEKEWLTEDGRVETNSKTLRVENAGEGARVYAIGDVSNFVQKAGVHNTLSAVPVLAANIKRDLTGKGVDKEFEEDTRETQLVPIGRGKGVGVMKGWWLPSLVVWLIKGRDYWLWTTGDVWGGKAWAKE